MKNNLLLLSFIAGTMITSGCASIMTAEQQTIKVTTSNNAKVEVTVDDSKTTTPGVVTVLRDGKNKVVRANANGCDNATPIDKEITPVFWGNIVIGGVLGSTTDGTTGKMWDYDDEVQVICAN